MERLTEPSLDFIKFLDKQKIKAKETIMQTPKSNIRTMMYRTDVIKDHLAEDDYLKIQDIFKAVWSEPITNFDQLLPLLNTLLAAKILIRLDRAPQKLKGPLLKWPKQMQIAEVL